MRFLTVRGVHINADAVTSIHEAAKDGCVIWLNNGEKFPIGASAANVITAINSKSAGVYIDIPQKELRKTASRRGRVMLSPGI